jgi:voltage-dependent potassium channel beta subunit
MEYRRLGTAGLKVSEFSFGAWVTFARQVDTDAAARLLGIAMDAGVNFLDNAEGYEAGRAEEVMGAALRQLNRPRDTYAVSTKVYWGGDGPMNVGLNRKHITDACHAGLKRLQVDYLDLYFCHRPDIDTPIVETVWAMHNLITQGKVMYWGTSEWTAQQLTEAYAAAERHNLTPPTMEQPEYNMFNRQKVEADFLPLYRLFGLGTTIWSPLASGLLTGKYNEGMPADSRVSLPGYEWLKKKFESPAGKAKIEKVRALSALAAGAGLSVTHMALLWCLRTPHVSTVILGASREEQLRDNLAALEHKSKFTPELAARIETILDNTPPAPQRFGN